MGMILDCTECVWTGTSFVELAVTELWEGGGGQRIICAQAHHEYEARRPLRPGSRARVKGPGSSHGF